MTRAHQPGMPDNLYAAIERIAGSKVERVVQKAGCTVALAGNRAFKIYALGDQAANERVVREFRWLDREGSLQPALHHELVGTDRFVFIVMRRLRDECCVGRLAVEGNLGKLEIEAVINYLASLQERVAGEPISAANAGAALLSILFRQLNRLKDTMPMHLSMHVAFRARAEVANWIELMGPATPCASAVHGNLSTPNLFIDAKHVTSIDPGLLAPDVLAAPSVTDQAALYADLLIHSSEGTSEPLGLTGEDSWWHGHSGTIFTTSVVTKLLVRLYFAKLERNLRSDLGWVKTQNELIVKRTLKIVESVAN